MLTIRNQYLQHYYEKAGDYRNAYKYLKRDYQLNDSIRSERIRTRVAELDMRYRQDTIVLRKEMQIQRQAGEVRVLRLSMYIWVLVCLLLAAGTVVIIWYMRKKREFLRERFFQQINRVRMENLRSRISPHFTFNVLGREINQFNGSEEVKNNLMELVKYLRRSLELTEKVKRIFAGRTGFRAVVYQPRKRSYRRRLYSVGDSRGGTGCKTYHDSFHDCSDSGRECD